MKLLKRFHPPGTSPGTLTALEGRGTEKATIRIFDYGPDHLEEKIVQHVEDCFPYVGTDTVTWIDVDGIGEVEVIRKLGEQFKLHPLALEDVLNIPQRPKVEEYEDQLFIVTRMVSFNETMESEQVSMFLGRNYLITFQERPGDCFDPVRERIRKNKGIVRQGGADYLAYVLMDALIDGYFPALEVLGERIEELEDNVMENPSRETLHRIHDVKRDLLVLRRLVWPEREAINTLLREETPLINVATRTYLRDCYDHTIQVMDVVETYRELASGLMDVYLSSLSNRMNEVMKTLTVVATIFIPLTFIVGIYGMNFNSERSPWNMPELNWAWGYPAIWLVMVLVVLGMLHFFRRKEWL
ncbi:MAG: magnesium/cobalt transporter CorA [Candidatus Latescibacterota bacterium]